MSTSRSGKLHQHSTRTAETRKRHRRRTPTALTPTAPHTPQEGVEDPWWHVDLGRELLHRQNHRVEPYRPESLGSRLANFTERVLDTDRRTRIPVGEEPGSEGERCEIKAGGVSPERIIRKAAMVALASVRESEADAFEDYREVFGRLKANAHRPFTHFGESRRTHWPKDDAKTPHLDTVLKFIRSLPVAERTDAAAGRLPQLGEGLTGLLEPAAAKAA